MSAVLKRVPQPRPKNNWLAQHAANITSQCGEDGIIEKVRGSVETPSVLPCARVSCGGLTAWSSIAAQIFEILPTEDDASQRWCVEFGAWDGHYLSNTWNLLNNKGTPAS